MSGWLADQQRRGLMPNTIDRRRYALATFARFVDPLKATEHDITSFLDARPDSARTTYCWLSTLHVFYVWARRSGLVDHDPTIDIPRPRLRRRLPRPGTNAQLATAIGEADRQTRAWLTLMAYAGLRCAEVARSEHSDLIDVSDRKMLHVIGKGERERIIPAHPMVIEVFGSGWSRSGPMFRRTDGAPWTPAQVSQITGTYLRSVGVDASAHQLRHWFGSRTYATSRGDLRVVQELLGHSSPATTAVYTAWSQPAAVAAVEAL